jgi:hypothetical protein
MSFPFLSDFEHLYIRPVFMLFWTFLSHLGSLKDWEWPNPQNLVQISKKWENGPISKQKYPISLSDL